MASHTDDFYNYKCYTASAGTTHNVATDLGRPFGINLSVQNTGASSISFTITSDFVNALPGDAITVAAGGALNLTGLHIKTITTTATTSYQIIVY